MEGRLYTPGAGHRPPLLAGRDELLNMWRLACADVMAEGRVASDDLVLTGPRGTGKTATMNAMSDQARDLGFEVLSLQAVHKHGFVSSLIDVAHERASEQGSGWTQRITGAFSRLRSANVSALGLGVGAQWDEPKSVDHASPAIVAAALADLATAVRADKDGGAGVVIALDEIQVAGDDLALLAAALHRLNVDHPQARVMFVGNGLPETHARMVEAGVTHPDRLFNIMAIPPRLNDSDARLAVVQPALARGVTWAPAAADAVVAVTGGHPAQLQAVALEVWRAAPGPSVITMNDAELGMARAAANFERRNLAPRWEALTPRQKEYLTALAVAGGRARGSQVSAILGSADPRQDSYLRAELIKAGDIYTIGRNEVAIASPLAARYAIATYETTRADSSPSLQQLQETAQALKATALSARSSSHTSRSRKALTSESATPSKSRPSKKNLGSTPQI